MADAGNPPPPPGRPPGDRDKDGSPTSSPRGSRRGSTAASQGIPRERVLALAAQTANEASPLLSPRNSADVSSVADSSATLAEDGLSVVNRSILYLMILTLSIGG